MQQPLEIQFHNMDKSEAVESVIRTKAAKLEKFADTILSCRVTIDAPHQHHHKGKLFHVAVDIHVPGGHVVASRDPNDNQAHEDVYVAIADAFEAARRQLKRHLQIRRGRVKTHEAPAMAERAVGE